MQINEEDNIYKTNFPDLEQMPKIGSFKYFLGWVIDKFNHIVEKYYYAKFSLKRKNVEIELLKKEVEYLKVELDILKSSSTYVSSGNIVFLPNQINK
jgi:hypothetical protein